MASRAPQHNWNISRPQAVTTVAQEPEGAGPPLIGAWARSCAEADPELRDRQDIYAILFHKVASPVDIQVQPDLQPSWDPKRWPRVFRI